MDLLTVCNLGILINALDFETYCYPGQAPGEALEDWQQRRLDKYDWNAMSYVNRRAAIHTRALAFDLLHWFASVYELNMPRDDRLMSIADLMAFAEWHLGNQMSTILHYKLLTEKLGWDGAPHCTADRLSSQLANVFEEDFNPVKHISAKPGDSLAMNRFIVRMEHTDHQIRVTDLKPEIISTASPLTAMSYTSIDSLSLNIE